MLRPRSAKLKETILAFLESYADGFGERMPHERVLSLPPQQEGVFIVDLWIIVPDVTHVLSVWVGMRYTA